MKLNEIISQETEKLQEMFKIQKKHEMLTSLRDSIDSCGGSVNMFDIEKMTVMELIETLAPNDVRFIYTGGKNTKFGWDKVQDKDSPQENFIKRTIAEEPKLTIPDATQDETKIDIPDEMLNMKF